MSWLWALIAYWFLAMWRIGKMFGNDEINYIAMAHRVAGHLPVTDFYSPPLYLGLLFTSVVFFGVNELSLRLVGVLCVAAGAYFIIRIARRLYHSLPYAVAAGSLAALLYAIHPMTVQGSLLIDIDNTVMTPLLLLTIISLIGYRAQVKHSHIMLLIVVTLFFLAKLSTPIIFMAAAVIVSGKTAAQKDERRDIAVISFSAFGLFLLLWSAITTAGGVSFGYPFQHWAFLVHTGFFAPLRDIRLFAQNIADLAVWFNPALLVATILCAIRPEEGLRAVPGQRYLSAGVMVLLTYLAIAPIDFGFPRYYVPLVALSALLLAPELCRLAHEAYVVKKLPLLIIVAGFLVAVFLFAGDPVYAVRYLLRRQLILGVGDAHLALLKIMVAFLVATGATVLTVAQIAPMRRVLVTALAMTGVAGSLSLSLMQARAPYQTNYDYGQKKFTLITTFVRGRLGPGDKIIAPPDLVYYANRGQDTEVWHKAAAGPEAFLAAIDDPKVRVVAYGVASCGTETYRRVLRDPRVMRALETTFTLVTIEEYSVWVRPTL